MDIVIHRVNQIEKLKALPREYGVEIDIRADGDTLVLNHDPFKGGERFVDWLEHYQHGLLVLNLKEAGIEAEVIRLVEARGIRRFFLLDVEFPYLYRAARQGERRIASRYSEDEALQTTLNYRDKVDWVWIDTNTRLPLDADVVKELRGFKTCLVCPERWGRPQDIPTYRREMAKLGFAPDAVMTALAHAPDWVKPLEPAQSAEARGATPNATPTKPASRLGNAFKGTFWMFLVLASLAIVATWANVDYTGRRAFLDMDEMLSFDAVRQILHPGDKGLAWALFDGDDQRYGRLFHNASALFAAVPDLLFGEAGMVLGIRSAQVLFLLGAYALLACTFLRTTAARVLAVVCLGALPFTSYYLTQPKPEPLQLLCLAAFFACAVPRRFRFGGHWIFLGLAFGLKISAAPLIAMLGAVGVLAVLLNREKLGHALKSLSLATGSFIAGWVIAVPTLLLPTKLNVEEYLKWTFKSTGHPWDSASVDIFAWLKSLMEGTAAVGHGVAPAAVATVLVAALALLAVEARQAWSRRAHATQALSEHPEWVLLAGAAALAFPILFAVKRLWGFYLHPGETLAIVALFAIAEARWQRASTTGSNALPVRIIAATACAALTASALNAASRGFVVYQRMASRSANPVHLERAATYAEITDRLNAFAEAGTEQGGRSRLQVFYDPFLYIPESDERMEVRPYWEPFNAYDIKADVIVMGHALQIGYFIDETPLPEGSARLEGLKQARLAFQQQVDQGEPAGAAKPYRLAAWTKDRKAAILVRSEHWARWQQAVSTPQSR